MPTVAELMSLGIRAQEAGDLARAELLYRQALAAESGHPNARFRLAVICQLQGRPGEAVEHYRLLLQSQPASAQAHNNLGLCLAALNRHAEALPHCREAVRLKADCAEFINNLGTIHQALGELDEADSAFRRAVELKAKYPAAWSNLGKLHLARNQPAEAVRCFQEALALQPNDPIVLTNLGGALLHQGKAHEAANCLRQALRIRPDYADAHRNLMRVQETFQAWQETARREEERLRDRPDDANGYAALADLYYYGLGRQEEAARCYRRVAQIRPDDARARFLADVLGGSAQLTRVPADQVGAMYDPFADQFDRRALARGDCSPGMLEAALGSPPPAPQFDVLDLGCGTGLCGARFRSWAKTLVGVDLAGNMLEQARKRGIYDELIHGDLLDVLKSCPGRFDLIVASDVLLLLGDLQPVIDGVHSALRPGGRFAFTIDLLEGPGDYQLSPWLHFAHSPHYVERLADQAGLRIVQMQKVIFPRDGGHEAPGFAIVISRP